MSATAQKPGAAGELRTQFFDRPARFEIAVPIRKANDPVRVSDVEKLRIGSRRIEGKPKWFVQPRVSEKLD